MHSIGLQIHSCMEWKRKCIEPFRKIRGGIAGVIIINNIFLNIILVIISAFNWITNTLMHGMEKEIY